MELVAGLEVPMPPLNRRRFVQVTAAGASQARRLAGLLMGALSSSVTSACRSLRDVIRPPKIWVFPSLVGDFIIVTSRDLEDLDHLPIHIKSRRFEFPAVAATLLQWPLNGSVDSDRSVVLEDV